MRIFKVYFLSNFQEAYILLTRVIMLYMEPWRLIHFVTGGLYPLTNISFPLPRLPVFFPQSMIDLYILQTSSMINIANLFPQISPLSFALACEDFFHVKTFFFSYCVWILSPG